MSSLLSLPDSRFVSEDVLALLDVPVLAARFDISRKPGDFSFGFGNKQARVFLRQLFAQCGFAPAVVRAGFIWLM